MTIKTKDFVKLLIVTINNRLTFEKQISKLPIKRNILIKKFI